MTVTHLRRLAAVVALALAATALLLLRPGGGAQALTSVPAAASAAGSGALSGQCTGEQQGVIKGGSNRKGRVGTYEISKVTHGLTVPTDPSSGQPTGRRQHEPLAFTMNVDSSTTQLIAAEITNENLKTCAFSFWRRSSDGAKEIRYLRIDLRDAHVVDYRFTGQPGGPDVVTFRLAYRTIEWTYPLGNLSTTDDWYYTD
ncbi:hypothetical protein GCM10023340_18140 [Nocardioides marinquilinus]|uniref:Type VI secretion system tube protein Hcp n=1 Tax=Nocardioides marinquilinus TaxID=1210400 RepID=A0ABP9PHW3_9ACTN